MLLNVATPAAFTAPVPISDESSKNCTAPVAETPIDVYATVAVSVVALPFTGGFGVTASVVAVAAGGTTPGVEAVLGM